MGADQSAPELPIYPQPQPICATEPRFCLPHNVHLHLRESFFSLSSDDFKITDVANENIIYFQGEGRRVFSMTCKKILRNNMGAPVLNMNDKMFSSKDQYKIFAGQGSERQICKFNSQITSLKAKLSTDFPDVINRGISRHLVLEGDWR